MTTAKQLIGRAPKTCDVCDKAIADVFYDAATKSDPWAYMCPHCFSIAGRGKLGLGLGQEYTLQEGKWLKTKG